MAADALSDVLKAVRLTGATFFDIVARAPWAAESAPRELLLPKILPGASNLIAYHVITEGSCYASMDGVESMALEAGDVIVFTRGDLHVLSSSPGMRADPEADDSLAALVGRRLPIRLDIGNEGPVSAKFVCGFLACDAQPFNPLLDNLPPIIRVSGRPNRDEPGSDADWLAQFVRLAIAESGDKRAGGESVLARLSELMFIEVVRRHLASLAPAQAGWLAGLRDPFVGKALTLLHARPAHDWTIEELGRGVGLSRSVLAERFADLVGVPPMLYLAKWRMQIAAGMHSAGNATMAAIAAEIGYGSEAAFSRAFKKLVGQPPSAWRRRGGDGPSGASN